ncbi:MAG: PAS domain-containing sensor histidine kinase [Candidatus Omnitrophota bacterium]
MNNIVIHQAGILYVLSAVLVFVLAAYFIYRKIIRAGLEKIKSSEADFQFVFEKAPEGVAIYAAETGRIVAVNNFFANLLGYPKNVFARSRIQEVTGWNDELFQEHVDNVLQGQIAYIPEVSFKQRGDVSIDVDVTSSPLTFKGTPCIVSFIRDISEKKKIERSLHEAKEYSDLLFHIVPSAIFTVDKDCMVTSWNKRAAELTGFSTFDVIGKHCSVFAEMPCKERCGLMAADIPKPSNNKEYTIRTKDGRGRTVMKNIDVIRAGDGKIIGGIETFEDITDRKRAEEKLRQLSQAVEQSPSTVVITDMDGAIEYVNPKFTELTGYQLHEVVGMNPRILKSGDKQANIYKELWDTIKAGRTWHGEFLNKKKSGETYWEFAAISGIKDPLGNITHYLKVSEDISDRKQLEKFKDEFVNTVSHELRTPLTAIRESINIVYDGSTGSVSDEQKDFLETAKRNVDRLGRLINEVLDFQKLQAGVMKFEKKETDINNLLEEVRQTMQMLMNKKGLELRMETAAGLPEVFVDRDKMIQVLVNLVNNAIKFTDKGSITLVSTLGENNTIKVSVVDTGIGIRKEDHAKLFRSFSQVSSQEYRKSGSTGLGLAITQEIVRQHGGKISVESEFGKGSTFYFILPVIDRRNIVRE